jgi:pre-mRNA-splicing factor CDC5/CEF1
VRELDGRKKKDVADEEIRKKQKKAKEATAKAQQGGAMANFIPAKEQQIQRLKEEQQISKRRKLALPAAQVGDQELEEIVKIGQAGEAARLAAGEGGNEAGRGLLGEYSALAHAKDTRTPRTAPQGELCRIPAARKAIS